MRWSLRPLAAWRQRGSASSEIQPEKDHGFYIGSARDLRARIAKHQSGAVFSTKPRRPFELIFYEAYRNEFDAKRREKYLKSTKGRATLRVMLTAFLETQGQS